MRSCQVCGEGELEGRDWVVCSRCESPHHDDCWRFAGHCSTFACGGSRPIPLRDGTDDVSPHEEPPLYIEEATDTGKKKPKSRARGRRKRRSRRARATDRSQPIRQETLPGPALERPRQRRPPEVSITTDIEGSRLNLGGPRAILDLTTPLECFVVFMTLVMFLATFVLSVNPVNHGFDWSYPWDLMVLPAAGTLVFVALSLFLSCHYELDNEDLSLLYVRSFLGLRWARKVARFDQIAWATVDGKLKSTKSSSWWEYWVVLVTQGGDKIPVSNSTLQIEQARGLARGLSSHLGARFSRGEARKQLVVTSRRGKLWIVHRCPPFLDPLSLVILAIGFTVMILMRALG